MIRIQGDRRTSSSLRCRARPGCRRQRGGCDGGAVVHGPRPPSCLLRCRGWRLRAGSRRRRRHVQGRGSGSAGSVRCAAAPRSHPAACRAAGFGTAVFLFGQTTTCELRVSSGILLMSEAGCNHRCNIEVRHARIGAMLCRSHESFLCGLCRHAHAEDTQDLPSRGPFGRHLHRDGVPGLRRARQPGRSGRPPSPHAPGPASGTSPGAPAEHTACACGSHQACFQASSRIQVPHRDSKVGMLVDEQRGSLLVSYMRVGL